MSARSRRLTSGKMSSGVESAEATCRRMRSATSCLSRTCCTMSHDVA